MCTVSRNLADADCVLKGWGYQLKEDPSLELISPVSCYVQLPEGPTFTLTWRRWSRPPSTTSELQSDAFFL